MSVSESVSRTTNTATQPRGLSSRRNQERMTKTLAYVIASFVALAFIFPLYWMVTTSLKTDVEIFMVPPTLFPVDPQWQNYPASTQYIPFWQYMFNTLVICALTIVGTVISCSLIAYGFARVQWPGRNAIFIIYLSTIMLPAQVTMIPLYIVFRQMGWVGTMWPLVVPAFFGNALYVFLLRQFFMTIPNELTDAARIDGANELGIFWRIMLPLLKPALATVALFTFVATYRDFLGPLIYLTEQNQWTISLGLKMFQNMYGAQWQLMMAAATLTMIPTMILFFLTQRTFIEGIALTGIKG
jgi:multiple sugar transport system permease protein